MAEAAVARLLTIMACEDEASRVTVTIFFVARWEDRLYRALLARPWRPSVKCGKGQRGKANDPPRRSEGQPPLWRKGPARRALGKTAARATPAQPGPRPLWRGRGADERGAQRLGGEGQEAGAEGGGEGPRGLGTAS